MGTEVLRPQDCLIHHQRIRVAPVVFPRRKSNNYYGNGGNRKVQVRPEPQKQQRRRSPEPAPATAPAGPKRSASVGDLKSARSNQVTLLRRGQSPTPSPSLRTNAGEFADDIYAGSAFSLSPSPRAVPLPSFFNRKTCPNTAAVTVDDSATKDLRRILRLE